MYVCMYVVWIDTKVTCNDKQKPPWHSVESDKHQQQSTDSALKLEAAQMWDTFMFLEGMLGVFILFPRTVLTKVFECLHWISKPNSPESF